MREIKVRAYEPVNQIMFFYNEMDGRETMQFYIDAGIVKAQVVVAPEDESDDPFGYKHFPCEVMQFTGLCDSEGTDVYEDDIINAGYGAGQIIFREGSFFIEWIDDKEANIEPLGWIKNNRPRTGYIIIGNIYEHPYLVNKQ